MKTVTLILSFLLIIPCPASVTCGGATTDRIDCSSVAALDNPSSVSISIWIYPTTLTDGKVIIGKTRPSTGNGWRVFVSGTGGNLGFYWDRATTDLSFITNNTPISTTNKWYYVAATADTSGAHIYVGDGTGMMTEATYGTSNVGSGAFAADASFNFMIGNNHNSPTNGSFVGDLEYAKYWHNVVLTEGQLKTNQFRTNPIAGFRLFVPLYSTSYLTDWSGQSISCTNFGAANGTTHAPVPPPFALRQVQDQYDLLALARLWFLFGGFNV